MPDSDLFLALVDGKIQPEGTGLITAAVTLQVQLEHQDHAPCQRCRWSGFFKTKLRRDVFRRIFDVWEYRALVDVQLIQLLENMLLIRHADTLD